MIGTMTSDGSFRLSTNPNTASKVFCAARKHRARRPRVYAFIRPIMDFMQTMPAFVFMIPVIAFFGTGKPAAIVTTMIFGGTPVVRLTVLGLRGVPESIREAAVAYGASKWYLLTRVVRTVVSRIVAVVRG